MPSTASTPVVTFLGSSRTHGSVAAKAGRTSFGFVIKHPHANGRGEVHLTSFTKTGRQRPVLWGTYPELRAAVLAAAA